MTTPPTRDGEVAASGTDTGARSEPDASGRIDEPPAYLDAVAELETILDELEREEVDIDVLGARVRRASELIRLCRDRVTAARTEVEQVVAQLQVDPDGAD